MIIVKRIISDYDTDDPFWIIDKEPKLFGSYRTYNSEEFEEELNYRISWYYYTKNNIEFYYMGGRLYPYTPPTPKE